MRDDVALAPVPTEYTICPLPEDNINYRLYLLTLQRRPGDRWVIHRMGEYLDNESRWSYGSSLAAEWAATHWHTFGRAVELAAAMAPTIRVNGLTAADALERADQRRRETDVAEALDRARNGLIAAVEADAASRPCESKGGDSR